MAGGKKVRTRRSMSRKVSTAKLVKDVAKLKRDARGTQQFHHLAAEVNATMGSITGSPSLSIFNLCNWYSSSPIFGSSTTDVDLANSYYHRGFGLDVYVTNNDESENINYTAFLVSLKDNIGFAFDPNTGNLSLTNPLHFYNNSLTALTMLNKGNFEIHKIKRFTLGNMGVGRTVNGLQTQYGNSIRWYWKIRVGKKISCATQSMKTQSSSLDPSKNYYLIIANDNSTADLEVPIVRATVIHTIQTNM